jgi:hypothetical protein
MIWRIMATIDGLPPLRDVIRDHDLAAKKSLGQNFLLDLNLTAKIARMAGDLTKCDVLEVGPGPGGLTRGLLAEGARHILAIEKDPALYQRFTRYCRRPSGAFGHFERRCFAGGCGQSADPAHSGCGQSSL